MSTTPETTPEKQAKPAEITTQVLSRLEDMKKAGEIRIPDNYSPENALKSAQLHLAELKDKNGKPALEVCTKESIANALLKMVVQALSVSKNQCYFIVYGNQLNYQRSYFGSIALGKRVAGVLDCVPVVIYKGDEFEFGVDIETGYRKILKHVPSFQNINNANIEGCYAIAHFADGRKTVEVMTISEIEDAWNQGQAKGNSPAHKNFRQEMSKKVVINRALKIPINSSDDSHLFFDEDFPEYDHVEDAQIIEDAPKVIEMKPKDSNSTFEHLPKNVTLQKEPEKITEPERSVEIKNQNNDLFPETK